MAQIAHHCRVQFDRWEKEYCDLVAEGHAVVLQMLCEATGIFAELPERIGIYSSVGKFNADGGLISRVPVDTFMGDIEVVPRAVKETPPFAPVEFLLCFVVAAIIQTHYSSPLEFLLSNALCFPEAGLFQNSLDQPSLLEEGCFFCQG